MRWSCCTGRRGSRTTRELLTGHHPAQRRLAFEELLAHQLSLRLRKLRTAADPGLPLTDPAGSGVRGCSPHCPSV